MQRRYGALSSSVDPQQLSLTVTAGARTLLSLLVMTGYMTTVDLDTVLMQIPVMVMAGFATWQGIETAWGGLRKIINLFYPPTE